MGSPAGTLKVSRRPGGDPEIFYSLQGEGPSLGTPSVFLRLALCNLICTWCDTKYTWDWRNHDYRQEVVELSREDVMDAVQGHGCRRLVVTGGEPLVQQKALAPLVDSLKGRGFSFEVETNGTLAPLEPLVRSVDQWNVSPKLGSSGNSPRRRDVAPAMAAFAGLPTAFFKFVVVDRQDVDEVESLVCAYGIRRNRVLLMPEGTSKGELQGRSGWLSELCVERGFRFTTRLHILLWGDERGR
ncbi:MAG: 7-carboxy-7-deazaguanine synthase QueE [Dehalococcoidia bacterium]|nr:7-carboxy-7-deazaguanine synthase QueE [Dehalococcoidia bacterium]